MFVLYAVCRWRDLPPELGCRLGHTTWRRLCQWHQARVWEQLHQRVLEQLSEEQILNWVRASIDSVSARAKKGGRADRSLPD